MDTVLVFHYDINGKVCFPFLTSYPAALGKSRFAVLENALNQTAGALGTFSPELSALLTGRRFQMRISDSFTEWAGLWPHEFALHTAALEAPAKADKAEHTLWLIALLAQLLYHHLNSNQHISRVRLHSLYFLNANRKILAATIRTFKAFNSPLSDPEWLAALTQIDNILLLEKFWRWLGRGQLAQTVLKTAAAQKRRFAAVFKNLINKNAHPFILENALQAETVRFLTDFKEIFLEPDSVIFVYHLDNNLRKAIRLCWYEKIDAMSSEAACQTVYYGEVRTDIFHDHGKFIAPWLDNLRLYAKDPTLAALAQMLVSDEVLKVYNAIDRLLEKIRKKQNRRQALRLLYAALYYWFNPDKGISRSVCLQVNKHLEDILTERPYFFPPSQANKSVFRGQAAVISIQTVKPHTVRREKIKARLLYAVNGRKKEPLLMQLSDAQSKGASLVFEAELPAKNGWIHYSAQVSFDNGNTWRFEELDPNSHGLLKYLCDERGRRVLSFYADTFNLQLDSGLKPVRDENGLYIYGTFDDIADQLPDIRDQGYTSIYPLGAFELGWAGEAGPDPSVFSVWDGQTVRRDMGGIEGLLRLQKRAESLNMKVILCVLSHFSRAYTSYAYNFPVYIIGPDGKFTRRAGWDGEWAEWLDSFMVNMRDFENVEYLAKICTELARMGFGLRVDVGHGFDAVFPVHQGTTQLARLLGQVAVGGFEPIDLRGSPEPNISLMYICYRVQKSVPNATIVYAEQWHGNETRMIKSGAIPYNSVIKNLEQIRSGQEVFAPLGLNDNLTYLNKVSRQCGGQTIHLFNSHDEEAPASNYQNMVWPTAAMLVFSSNGPVMYHISRLPGPAAGKMTERFDLAYTECWKHWVNNRYHHPWDREEQARQQILSNYPLLGGFGTYLRSLYRFVDEHHAFTKGSLTPIKTNNGRVAAFLRTWKSEKYLCVFNFPNPFLDGQQAAPRDFNFILADAGDSRPLPCLQTDKLYEVREIYNNAEGYKKRGKKELWSGLELLSLGFSGVAAPVSSHVFILTEKDRAIAREQAMFDSFLRYHRYGKNQRLRFSYIANAFTQTCKGESRSIDDFSKLFARIVGWIRRYRRLGISHLSVLLDEISRDNPRIRSSLIEFLLRIAANDGRRFTAAVRQGAVDVLQSVNIGTIVLVSPESQFSGNAGGVGIYTTDIADVLSELGLHVVIVTPLYECNRSKIINAYCPRYDGHSFQINFPEFDDTAQSMRPSGVVDIVNVLSASLIRLKHGRKSRLDVIYLENAKYLDRPYGGLTAEDKIRRARVLSQGALEALRMYNYYPSIIQTNEWPTWLLPAYLRLWSEYKNDAHFRNTKILSMTHNPHPSYSIVLNETNPLKRYYYCTVLGLDPINHADAAMNPYSPSGYEIDLTHTMLKCSDYIGTVSRAMKRRILEEPAVFSHQWGFAEKECQGRFFGRRNGFNMAARQRFWFATQKSILETYQLAVRKRLFVRYKNAKKSAKLALQSDPLLALYKDDEHTDRVIFSMLHRICPQKGFELLVDWKVYEQAGSRIVQYEPWKMTGRTVLEYFLDADARIQFIICGQVEDSFDGRRFDMHLRRIASRPEFRGRFAYYPQGALPPALYRNLYVGSQFFVMPSGGSIGEPCGISQQEAHAGGTPVIAHHQDGLQRTVCDRDFGDTHNPTNGIKFRGFAGQPLLDALLDAVEIYYNDRRRNYFDDKGRPKKLCYRDLCYNAFCTDHRWLRLLRDYIDMYAAMLGTKVPEHLDAVRLIVEMENTPDNELGDAVLRKGMEMPEAVDALIKALGSSLGSIRDAARNVLWRLNAIIRTGGYRRDITPKLLAAARSEDKHMSKTAAGLLQMFEKQTPPPQISKQAAQRD